MAGSLPTLDDIERAVREHQPQQGASGDQRARAAVATVLRRATGVPELLFIRRAEHPLDPWSGHIAFPGGRVEETDADPLAAAIRETREELALDLREHARLLGPLSHLGARSQGTPLPLVIEPWVFELEGDATLVPNEAEVDEVLWVPLSFLLEPAHRSSMEWRRNGAPIVLPCYYLGERRLWGLTLRMVDELLDLIR